MSDKFLVEWNKGDDERKSRFDQAVQMCPVIRVELVRSLLDEWAKTILSRDDIGSAVRRLHSPKALAVITTDAQGRITEINPAVVELCGYALRELVGKKPGSVLQGPKTEMDVVQRFRDAIRERKPFKGTLTNYHKNGTTYRVSIHMQPLFDGGGTLIGYRAEERKR